LKGYGFTALVSHIAVAKYGGIQRSTVKCKSFPVKACWSTGRLWRVDEASRLVAKGLYELQLRVMHAYPGCSRQTPIRVLEPGRAARRFVSFGACG